MDAHVPIEAPVHSTASRSPLRFWRRPFRRDESGQAIVETALFLPLFILLLMGVIDFGRYEYIGIVLGNGARAGAQYGSGSNVKSVDTGIVSTALADAASVTTGTTSVTTKVYGECASDPSKEIFPLVSGSNCPTLNDHQLTFVKVTMTDTFKPWIAYPGLPKTLVITSSAVLQISP
jgi:Flp pilus assembly protein TadG